MQIYKRAQATFHNINKELKLELGEFTLIIKIQGILDQ